MEIVAKIPADNSKAPGYYHSFGMSRNYFLFLEMPYRFNLLKMLFRNKAKVCFSHPGMAHPRRSGGEQILRKRQQIQWNGIRSSLQ